MRFLDTDTKVSLSPDPKDRGALVLVLVLSLSLSEEKKKNSFDRRKNISLVVPVLKFHRIHTSSLVLLKYYYSNHNQH